MIEKEGLEKDGMRLANPTPSFSSFTNSTATHTRSHCKPPSTPIVMSSLRLHKEQIRSVGFVWHQYVREKESFWQNKRESWTNILNFFFFFILLLLLIFLYKMVTWTRDWVFSWHLTEKALTEMNRRVCSKTTQTHKAQTKTFEVRRSK
jgi:hypothetical protein